MYIGWCKIPQYVPKERRLGSWFRVGFHLQAHTGHTLGSRPREGTGVVSKDLNPKP